MTTLDALAGTAAGGTLYGVGVGPGDVRYLTLRAAGLVRAVDVLAYFAKKGLPGNAWRIVTPLIVEGRSERRFEYPMTDEMPAESAEHSSGRASAEEPRLSIVIVHMNRKRRAFAWH